MGHAPVRAPAASEWVTGQLPRQVAQEVLPVEAARRVTDRLPSRRHLRLLHGQPAFLLDLVGYCPASRWRRQLTAEVLVFLGCLPIQRRGAWWEQARVRGQVLPAQFLLDRLEDVRAERGHRRHCVDGLLEVAREVPLTVALEQLTNSLIPVMKVSCKVGALTGIFQLELFGIVFVQECRAVRGEVVCL